MIAERNEIGSTEDSEYAGIRELNTEDIESVSGGNWCRLLNPFLVGYDLGKSYRRK